MTDARNMLDRQQFRMNACWDDSFAIRCRGDREVHR